MNFTEKISAEMKEAMKSGDKLRLETLRSLRAGILEFEKSGADREMLPDDELKILNSAAKKRKDAIELYDNNGRTEAADKERAELAIIASFLPEQMSEDEIRVVVREIIASTGAAQPSDLGRVMGAAMKQLKGKADGTTIQAVAKSLLSAG